MGDLCPRCHFAGGESVEFFLHVCCKMKPMQQAEKLLHIEPFLLIFF